MKEKYFVLLEGPRLVVVAANDITEARIKREGLETLARQDFPNQEPSIKARIYKAVEEVT